jgi:hypothetical protein
MKVSSFVLLGDRFQQEAASVGGLFESLLLAYREILLQAKLNRYRGWRTSSKPHPLRSGWR